MSVIVQLSCLIDPDKKAALMPFLEKTCQTCVHLMAVFPSMCVFP
jgi:hypothetical protein